METAVEGYDLSPGELWLHSIAVSSTAEVLARHKKFAETNDVFTPALLHDMGKLVLGQFVKEEQQLAATIVSIELVSILYKLSGISGQLTTNFLDTE